MIKINPKNKKLAGIMIVPFVLLISLTHFGCQQDNIDNEPPVIIADPGKTFPGNCDTLMAGETFIFRSGFTDNVALGSYSIDIHHNFNHHTHSTEMDACPFSPVKQAVNPFLLIAEYPIPDQTDTYQAALPLTIPAGIDTGDYHLMIRLTDKEGWSTFRGLSLKIITQ